MPYQSDWANIQTNQLMYLLRTQRRYVVGGNGSFDFLGKSWNWESYFQHGENSTSIKIYNMPLSGAPNAFGLGINGALSRFNLAQDAVFADSGADRLPQLDRARQWLRAVQSLRRRPDQPRCDRLLRQPERHRAAPRLDRRRS